MKPPPDLMGRAGASGSLSADRTRSDPTGSGRVDGSPLFTCCAQPASQTDGLEFPVRIAHSVPGHFFNEQMHGETPVAEGERPAADRGFGELMRTVVAGSQPDSCIRSATGDAVPGTGSCSNHAVAHRVSDC